MNIDQAVKMKKSTWKREVKTKIKNLNILFQAYNLMMNKITRSLMDILNKIKRCKM